MSDTPPPLFPESNQQPAPAGTVAPPDSGSGKKTAACCGIGCLVTLVVAVLLVVFGISFVKKTLGELAEEYTSDQPVEIVVPTIPAPQIEEASRRYDAFKEAMAEGTANGPLVLSETDLNALILHHPDFSGISKSASARMENDLLTVQTSFDLDTIPIPFPFLAERVKGKFFNGEVTLRFGEVAGRPALYIDDLAVGDQPIPRVVIDSMKTENLLKEIQSDPEMKKLFEKVGGIAIENNNLVITPAGATP